MRPIPTWLRQHLIDTGHLTETGTSRRARPKTHHCGALILTGLDDDRCAGEATTDPLPLTPLGEALAHLEGRTTYQLTRRGRLELDQRNQWAITAHPAGTGPFDVLREHRCDTPPPAPDLTTTSCLPTRPSRQETPDACPF